MASKKSRSRKNLRTDADYIKSASQLSILVPSLKKFKRRKKLTRSEKRRIRYRERQLRNIPDLVPITAEQEKRLGKKRLFKRGVRAVQLKHAENSKIKITKRGEISVSNENQSWIYWPLSRDTVRSKRKMRDIGPAAFNKQFPIEKLSDMAILAFKKWDVQEIHLWSNRGAVGDGFKDADAFIFWVNKRWQNGRYISVVTNQNTNHIYENPSDPGKWINGIAILIENPEYTKKKKELKREKREAERAAARKKD